MFYLLFPKYVTSIRCSDVVGFKNEFIHNIIESVDPYPTDQIKFGSASFVERICLKYLKTNRFIVCSIVTNQWS